jgi:SAM-dependent methyltransferase
MPSVRPPVQKPASGEARTTFYAQKERDSDKIFRESGTDRPGTWPTVRWPNLYAKLAVDSIPPEVRSKQRAWDGGCGHGDDAISYAKAGFKQTVGVDFSSEALKQAQENARDNGVANKVVFEKASLAGYQFNGNFYLLSLNNTLLNILEEDKKPLVQGMMDHTLAGGYNVICYHTSYPEEDGTERIRKDGFEAKGLVRLYIDTGWEPIAFSQGITGRNVHGKTPTFSKLVVRKPSEEEATDPEFKARVARKWVDILAEGGTPEIKHAPEDAVEQRERKSKERAQTSHLEEYVK